MLRRYKVKCLIAFLQKRQSFNKYLLSIELGTEKYLFRLNTFSISSDNRGELMEVEQTGHQIIAALTPNAAGMQQPGMNMNSGMQQSGMYMNNGMQQSGMNMNSGMQQPGGLWKCQCGAENTGRFCEYCGQPRPF